MKKRLFFGFAFFVGIAMMFAWQIAAAELAELQKDANPSLINQSIEVVDSAPEGSQFI